MKNLEMYLNNSILEVANSFLNVQDMALLGISEMYSDINDIDDTYLHKIRLQLQTLYFDMKKESVNITQEQADNLNKKIDKVMITLEHNTCYDSSCDYWINFDHLVPTNESYGKICLC